jgi:hypothetical protein
VEPLVRLFLRYVVALAVGLTIVVAGAYLLVGAVLAESGIGGTPGAGTALSQLAGWLLLAAGPVVGLRLGGLGWGRALLGAPVVPLLVWLVAAVS